MRKPDYAHKLTDEQLAELEQRIAQIYEQAAGELAETVETYFKQFTKRDAAMLEKLEKGEITEQQYKQWRLAQIGRGERFKALRDKVATRYTDANATAVAYVNDATPGIYSLNRNYAAYKIEQVSDKADFTLWDEQTVKRLIVEQPDLMPYYPPKRALQRGIDLKYGKQQITASVTSSILQGKSIPKIANDLQRRMQDMNRTSAIRTARTAVTGAQNTGRLDTYRAAQDMGIKLKKRWLATLDGRTRHAHAMLDGQTVDIDKPFKVDGYEIMYPGDSSAPGYLVYNCRCTQIAEVDGEDTSSGGRRAIDPETGKSVLVKDITYSEWAGWKKEEKRVIIEPHTEAYKNTIESVKADKVEYIPVEKLKNALSESEIIDKIAGGDMTKGSCSSLAFAYIGNKCGLDVTDFRGGASQSVFAENGTIKEIAGLDGVQSKIVTVKKEMAGAVQVLKGIEQNKEYYIAVGQHAAIVRNTGKRFEYLELQSGTNNGWQPFVKTTLRDRFGCRKTQRTFVGVNLDSRIILMEADSFKGNDEFREILGYINTKKENQMKGAAGSVK